MLLEIGVHEVEAKLASFGCPAIRRLSMFCLRVSLYSNGWPTKWLTPWLDELLKRLRCHKPALTMSWAERGGHVLYYVGLHA